MPERLQVEPSMKLSNVPQLQEMAHIHSQDKILTSAIKWPLGSNSQTFTIFGTYKTFKRGSKTSYLVKKIAYG